MVDKLSLRIRIFLFFAALAGGVLIAIGAGFFAAMRRVTDPDVINVLVIQDFISGFLGLGIIAWVWFLFDIHVAKAIEGLAGAIRARAHADVDGEIDRDHARYLGDLAPAASAAVMTLAETRNALAESVARETTRIANDKLKLEALLSDVPLAVLLCTGRHHLAFYNGVAQEVLDAGKAHLGLDRNLFDFLRDGPVRQAHARLMKTDSPDAATEFICTTQTGNRRLAARMRLVGEGTPEAPCYVLTLRDVTAELALHGRQEALLNEVFERVRPPVAALQTARTALNGEAGAVETLVPALESLTGTIDELGERFEATRTDGWPLAPVRSEDLAARLARRLSARGLTSEQVADPLTLRCNAFDVVALMEHLGRRVDAALGGAALSVAVRRDAPGASLHLGWQGAAVGEGDLASWLEEPLDEGDSSLNGHAVIAAHGSRISIESDGAGAGIAFHIRQAEPAAPRAMMAGRNCVYDFGLLNRARTDKIADATLDELTYVVFDSETTGLLPAQGDELVQIAAVRIVNGKRIEGEVFDTLVNPGRSIPPSSTDVHGISEDMVKDAPGVLEVVERFHKFAEGSVLVAHNAPFDMAFLRRREKELGVRFENPIFDTVLLSAVVFGQSAVHNLDALTHRLSITIPEEDRHTAIGDTVATADAFIKLMAMLKAKGLNRFGEVIEEVRRHKRLLEDLN